MVVFVAYSLFSVVDHGQAHSSFSVVKYFEELNPSSVGQYLVLAKSISSTQRVLSAYVAVQSACMIKGSDQRLGAIHLCLEGQSL